MAEKTGECKLMMKNISEVFADLGIHDFEAAIDWVHKLPYGRNSDPADFMLIFTEKRGTCRTKHAALVALAKELGLPVQFKMVICKLNTKLAPKVAPFLQKLGVDYLPEGHCYLTWKDRDIDVTFPDQKLIPKVEVLEEHILTLDELVRKEVIHKEYLKSWSKEHKLSFEEVWFVRESWIDFLGKEKDK